VRADSCVSVCQPSLVLPPSFDSNAVGLLLPKESLMRNISILLATIAKSFIPISFSTSLELLIK
ncbi:hypothetical protein V7G70_11545, partial [Acinetobacter pittii]